MARVFAVTAAATNIRLNSEGRGQSSFTVSNASGRTLRGRADVRAADPRCQSWLAVSGEAEREYKVGETHQVSVSIAVPPGSPPGSCSFQLTVVSAANPDEDFDEGPLVTFDVAAAAAPAKGFPWWIVIVAAVVLAAVGGVLWWVLTREKQAPVEEVKTPAPAPVATRAVKQLAMQLAPNWVDYRDLHLDEALPYDGSSASRLGNLCIVQGMVENSSRTPKTIAVLPAECRPKERLLFNLNNNGATSRVDVAPTGDLTWETASPGQPNWLSLTGIAFAVGTGTPLLLTPGWQNYKDAVPQDQNRYQPAMFSKEGDLCVVSGLVRSSSLGGIKAQVQILVLPESCRPKERLIFNLNHHTQTARVDVLPNGQVLWVEGGFEHLWISLSGIVFTTGAQKAEALDLRWTNYGNTYAGGAVHRDGNVCLAEGLVKTTDAGGIRSRPQIATLAEGCRPANRLVFNLNNNENTARVDALADGRIFWQAGGSNHGWISLSGMVWVAETTR